MKITKEEIGTLKEVEHFLNTISGMGMSVGKESPDVDNASNVLHELIIKLKKYNET